MTSDRNPETRAHVLTHWYDKYGYRAAKVTETESSQATHTENPQICRTRFNLGLYKLLFSHVCLSLSISLSLSSPTPLHTVRLHSSPPLSSSRFPTSEGQRPTSGPELPPCGLTAVPKPHPSNVLRPSSVSLNALLESLNLPSVTKRFSGIPTVPGAGQLQ